jgi:PPM family protein phosphatase
MSAARFFFDADLEAPVGLDFAGGRAAVFSAPSPQGRKGNQDAAALIPFDDARGVLAVADGLGGMPAGERAARAALETLAASLAEARRAGSAPRDALLEGIDRANRAVLALGLGAATTLAACELDLPTVRTYHVGDSPVLVVGGRGKIKLETIAHSPVGYAVEAGLIDAEDAIHHEARHLVSNILGSDEMRVEVGSPRRLARRDTLVLATDGLVDNLHTREIAEALRRGPLEEALARLVAECRRRMLTPHGALPSKPDDLTIVAFRGA